MGFLAGCFLILKMSSKQNFKLQKAFTKKDLMVALVTVQNKFIIKTALWDFGEVFLLAQSER